jgi:hypothetical protein
MVGISNNKYKKSLEVLSYRNKKIPSTVNLPEFTAPDGAISGGQGTESTAYGVQ